MKWLEYIAHAVLYVLFFVALFLLSAIVTTIVAPHIVH